MRHILHKGGLTMECVAYMRVSTEKQAVEGNGLDSQKRDIENYCRKYKAGKIKFPAKLFFIFYFILFWTAISLIPDYYLAFKILSINS